MKAAELFIQALEQEGVKYIFCVPGEEILALLEAVRTSSIELLVLRHEQVAGFMAATYGRLTEQPGVCLSTLGPGATNLVTAVAYAQLGGMPMLVLTGQKPIKVPKQGKFQVLDVVNMMRPITKHTHQLVNVRNIATQVRSAFHVACTERPGVVHLELPEDVMEESCGCRYFDTHPIVPPQAQTRVLEQAVELIHAAKHPLVLIGAEANRKDTTAGLTQLFCQTKIPFLATQMGKGVVDEHNDCYLGTAALSEGDFLHCAINHADLIINVGHNTTEKPPFFMKQTGAKVIHVDFSPAQIEGTYFPQLEVVGDIACSIDYLVENVTPQSHWNLSYYCGIREGLLQHIETQAKDDCFPCVLPYLVHEVQRAMPPDGVLALDNGLYKVWFARNYLSTHHNALLVDNALATMGAGLPVAMAAKLVYPKRKVVAVCGDGGFLMNVQDLASAVQLKLDIVVLILRDDAYGMIKWKQAQHQLPAFGVDFTNPDFVELSKCHGASGHRITQSKDFYPTFIRCLEKKGVHLIEVPIDYARDSDLLGEGLLAQTTALSDKQ